MVHYFYSQGRETIRPLLQDSLVGIPLMYLRAHHDDSYRHSLRVGLLAADLGQELGITEQGFSLLVRGALLHDIGKRGIPTEILSAERKPTSEEWEILKQHPHLTEVYLKDHGIIDKRLLYIASAHHEFQRSPYPRAQERRQEPRNTERRIIPGSIRTLAAIIAIADKFDALVSPRAYKAAYTFQETQEALYQGFVGDQDLIQKVKKRYKESLENKNDQSP